MLKVRKWRRKDGRNGKKKQGKKISRKEKKEKNKKKKNEWRYSPSSIFPLLLGLKTQQLSCIQELTGLVTCSTTYFPH